MGSSGEGTRAGREKPGWSVCVKPGCSCFSDMEPLTSIPESLPSPPSLLPERRARALSLYSQASSPEREARHPQLPHLQEVGELQLEHSGLFTELDDNVQILLHAPLGALGKGLPVTFW